MTHITRVLSVSGHHLLSSEAWTLHHGHEGAFDDRQPVGWHKPRMHGYLSNQAWSHFLVTVDTSTGRIVGAPAPLSPEEGAAMCRAEDQRRREGRSADD